MNLIDKYLNEGRRYQKGKTSEIKELFNAAKGFVDTAETQWKNDYIKGGALLTLENLQKNLLKDLIAGLKKEI